MPVAADESIRRAEDPLAVVRADAADVVVLRCSRSAACARASTSPSRCACPWSCRRRSSRRSASPRASLAAALPALPYACGLATVNLFAADVVAEPLVPVDGALPVARPAPSAAALAATAPDAGTDRRWRARLERVAGLALAGGAR